MRAMTSHDVPTWPVAGGALLLGFGVADVTGVRPLGGLVLLAGAVWCARRWAAVVGGAWTAVLLALGLSLFVASHPLGKALGAWVAVAIVAAVAATAAWAVVDRRRAPARL